MKYRTVIMYSEIACFVVCVCGWILVCSTMPTEQWTWSEVESIVLTTSNYFSNLWKDCISDSTGVSDCKGFPSMLALQGKCTSFEEIIERFSYSIFTMTPNISFVNSVYPFVPFVDHHCNNPGILRIHSCFSGNEVYQDWRH